MSSRGTYEQVASSCEAESLLCGPSQEKHAAASAQDAAKLAAAQTDLELLRAAVAEAGDVRCSSPAVRMLLRHTSLTCTNLPWLVCLNGRKWPARCSMLSVLPACWRDQDYGPRFLPCGPPLFCCAVQLLAQRESELGNAWVAAAQQGVAAENAAQGFTRRIAALVDVERETTGLQVTTPRPQLSGRVGEQHDSVQC